MNESEKPNQRPTYSSYTYDSKHPMKRAIHRNRYKNILKNLGVNSTTRVCDYGAGDGRLFRILIDSYGAQPSNLIAFDPVVSMVAEFKRLVPEVRIVSNAEELVATAAEIEFDYVFCCEVFEHLNKSEISAAMRHLVGLAGPQTTVLVEVPIEIGPVGLAKNVFRRFVSGVQIPVEVMTKAFFGIAQERKPRVVAPLGETLEHPGFSFHETRRDLLNVFRVISEFNDPFRRLPFIVNNSKVFVCRPK